MKRETVKKRINAFSRYDESIVVRPAPTDSFTPLRGDRDFKSIDFRRTAFLILPGGTNIFDRDYVVKYWGIGIYFYLREKHRTDVRVRGRIDGLVNNGRMERDSIRRLRRAIFANYQ